MTKISYKDIEKKIQNEGILAIEWSIEDVKHQCPLLNDDESKNVLEYMIKLHSYYHKHDAERDVIVWEIINSVISECFPEKWNEYIEEWDKG